MKIEIEHIRNYRLLAHHLERKLAFADIKAAAGACGIQNSPPGAWETAMYHRLEGCTLQGLNAALYEKKELLQAWGRRGVPVVFPTGQSDIFLTPLTAQEGEEPWIYTRGITGALEFLGMQFDELLALVKKAAVYLDNHTVKSKELLDSMLAEIVEKDLPQEKRVLWNAPSMYGSPDKQTMGGAAVSFLLRPCSFASLVVFGEREGASPTFTSFKNWTGREPDRVADAAKELTRKYLHCYGPSTVNAFANWLGCSPRQARRLWDGIADEMHTVRVDGKCYDMLETDMESLASAKECGERLVLLGAHDPYLEMPDRAVILENKELHGTVWRTVANPGAVIIGGRIVGVWRTKTQRKKMDMSVTLFEDIGGPKEGELEKLAEEYAGFRLLDLRSCAVGRT